MTFYELFRPENTPSTPKEGLPYAYPILPSSDHSFVSFIFGPILVWQPVISSSSLVEASLHLVTPEE